MKCQPAYFSQVLREKAHLTEDQIVQLAEFLGFQNDETDYFLVLLRLDKSATPALRTHLQSGREELLKRLHNLDGRVASGQARVTNEDLAAYYSSDWLPAAIHIATSCADYQTVPAIAQRLMISESQTRFHLQKLLEFDLVTNRKEKWILRAGSVHFSRGSTYDLLFQTSRRLLVLDSLKRRTEQDLHYAVIYATDLATQKKLKKRLLDFIETLHQDVEPTPAHEVHAMVFDLFRL